MKRLHRSELWCWSAFNERLDIDFNSVLWTRPDGNVAIDPLPLSPHDLEHVKKLGGVATIVLTNSAHVRGAAELAKATGASLWGPAQERSAFPVPCARWLGHREQPLPGLETWELEGSKTPGELALILEETTVFFGDLVRSHRANQWGLLRPEQGIKDEAKARASVRALLDAHPRIEAVLVGDGWCQFRDGHRTLSGSLDAA